MNSLCLLVLAATMGVEAGWQPLPDGGHEYTIQLEPQLLGLLAKGDEEIISEVPPELDVRRYRIIVGSGKLARDAGPQPAAVAARPQATQPLAPAPQPAAGPAASAFDFGDPPADDDPYERDDRQQPADFDLDPPASEPDAAPPASSPPEEEANPWSAVPDDDFDTQPSDPTPPATETKPDAPIAGAHIPGKLPPDGGSSNLVDQAGFNVKQGAAGSGAAHDAERPQLDGEEGIQRPWPALIGSIVLLGASLGANVYLGWVAWGARNKYLDAIAKFRGAAA